mmetsp:Transcript_2814/g.8493  ORF Transcript_2814/g.8493 Transcript_2814/m.8493 type:complete len:228 (+) Transcript_2814:878-1561(+)
MSKPSHINSSASWLSSSGESKSLPRRTLSKSSDWTPWSTRTRRAKTATRRGPFRLGPASTLETQASRAVACAEVRALAFDCPGSQAGGRPLKQAAKLGKQFGERASAPCLTRPRSAKWTTLQHKRLMWPCHIGQPQPQSSSASSKHLRQILRSKRREHVASESKKQWELSCSCSVAGSSRSRSLIVLCFPGVLRDTRTPSGATAEPPSASPSAPCLIANGSNHFAVL